MQNGIKIGALADYLIVQTADRDLETKEIKLNELIKNTTLNVLHNMRLSDEKVKFTAILFSNINKDIIPVIKLNNAMLQVVK